MRDILQLKDFLITRLHVDWKSPTQPAKNEESFRDNLTVDYDVLRNPETQHLFALEFRVRVAPKNRDGAGYSIEAEIVGFFDFPETMEEEKIQYLVRVNGGTILYGILRGQIALITGSFAGGKYTLPTVFMTDVVKQVEATRARPKAKHWAKRQVSAKNVGAANSTIAAKKAETRLKKK